MLVMFVIEMAHTESAGAIVFAQKKDETIWLFVDYHKLNPVRIREFYLILHIGECIYSLGDATVFPILNGSSGCWLGEVVNEYQDKTALVSNHGLICIIRMSLRLKPHLRRFNP